MKSEENLLLKSKECQKTQQLKYDTGKKLTPQDTERSLALQWCSSGFLEELHKVQTVSRTASLLVLLFPRILEKVMQ